MFIALKFSKYIIMLLVILGLGSCYNKPSYKPNNFANMKTQANNAEPSWHIAGYSHFTNRKHSDTKLISTADGNIYLIFRSKILNQVLLRQYNKKDKAWDIVGFNSTDLVKISGNANLDIATSTDSNFYLAFTDSSNLKILQYTQQESLRKQLGSSIIVSNQVQNISIAINPKTNLPCVSYTDYQDNKPQINLMCYHSDNNLWVKLTNPYSNVEHTEYNKLAFTKDGTPYLAFAAYGFNLGRATVISYNFATNSWQNVGAVALSNGIAEYINLLIDPNDKLYLSFADQGDQERPKVLTYNLKFNNWTVLGNSAIFCGSGKYVSLTLSPKTSDLYLAFQDYTQLYNIPVFHFNNSLQQWDPVPAKHNVVSNSIYDLSFTIGTDNNLYMAFSYLNEGVTKLYNSALQEWEDATLPTISDLSIGRPQLAIASDGGVYMGFNDSHYSYDNTVMRYDPNTQQLKYMTSDQHRMYGFVSNLALSPQDKLFYAYRNQDSYPGYGATVLKYNESLGEFEYILKEYQRNQDLDNLVISFSVDGSLYLAYSFPVDKVSSKVVSSNKERKLFVHKYDENNKTWIDIINDSSVIPFGLSSLSKFSIDKNGVMYFVFDNTNNIRSYNLSTKQWDIALQLQDKIDVFLLDQTRNKIYYQHGSSSPMSVAVYDIESKQSTDIGKYWGGGSYYSSQLALDKQGTLYILSSFFNDSIRIDTYNNGIYHTLPTYNAHVSEASIAISNNNTVYVFYQYINSGAGRLIYYQ